MTLKKRLGSVAGAAVLLMFLAACAAPSAPGDDLVGSTWSGTDDRGAEWEFEFQEDKTVAFTRNDKSFDDASDTWTVAADELRISLAFFEGTVTMVGPYENGDESIELFGQQDGVSGSWTLTITE